MRSGGVDANHHVAAGYDADVLIRWGDPVVSGAPPFDPAKQTAAAQRQQFGYNCDFIGYFPMPGVANPSQHGLLAVNLEYTNEELMFPGLRRQDVKDVLFAEMTAELVDIEMAAHGGAVIEVRRDNGKWRVVEKSKYARRIDATSPMEITGPAAGHPRLQTSADPTGRRVLGMINNCAGHHPWDGSPARNFAISRRAARRTGSAQSPALWRSWQFYAWGKFTIAECSRSRTRPTASAGLSRSTRSTRPRH
jgi:secreted PhoX family phosphatase